MESDLVGAIGQMRFAEPFDSDRIVTGRVTGIFSYDSRHYAMFEDMSSGDKYLIMNRYVGQTLNDLLTKRFPIVGIFILRNEQNGLSPWEFLKSTKYLGPGSVDLGDRPQR